MRKAVALSAIQRRALVGKYEIKGRSSFEILEQDGQLMLSLREGAREPVYAASPTVLFVLSRAIELHLARDGSAAGRLMSGAFEMPFERIRQPGPKH
jgi:hypothetical protein